MKKTVASFYPCWLEVPEREIFDSNRNLGIALCSALTGTPCEDVELNRTAVSIGLGCFSLISVGYDGCDDDINPGLIDPNEDWSLNSTVVFDVTKEKDFLSDDDVVVIGSANLFLNISSALLLRGELSGIQLFGAARYLKLIKSSTMKLVSFDKPDEIEFGNYLEDGLEPSNGILCPSEEEFALFVEEKDVGKKFRILLNVITTFASELSVRMQLVGRVRMSMICYYGGRLESISREMNTVEFESPWCPSKQAAEDYMKRNRMTMDDIAPKVKKLIWGE